MVIELLIIFDVESTSEAKCRMRWCGKVHITLNHEEYNIQSGQTTFLALSSQVVMAAQEADITVLDGLLKFSSLQTQRLTFPPLQS